MRSHIAFVSKFLVSYGFKVDRDKEFAKIISQECRPDKVKVTKSLAG